LLFCTGQGMSFLLQSPIITPISFCVSGSKDMSAVARVSAGTALCQT
jgi:hypothetical protein